MTYSQVWWPILGIFALQLTHSKCTCRAARAAAPGEQLEVWCLAQGHLSRGIEGGETAVNSLPPPTIPAGPRDSNLQTVDYESLTIRLIWLGLELGFDLGLLACNYAYFIVIIIVSTFTCMHLAVFLWLSGRALRQQRKRLWFPFPGNTHTKHV